MRQRRFARIVAVMLIAQVSLAGCDVIGVPPPGMRQLIVSVENKSAEPARLFVSQDGPTGGWPLERVGTALPDTVAPGVTRDVVFTVPRDDPWIIFVNPSAQAGGLIASVDVPPDVSGATPLNISVAPNGEPSVNAGRGGPGWFGQ